MAFHVGQEVLCINAAPTNYGATGLVAGRIYVIRGLDDEDDRFPPGLYLHGVRNVRAVGWLFPVGFRPERFRPIVNRETDISALKALLVPGAQILERA